MTLLRATARALLPFAATLLLASLLGAAYVVGDQRRCDRLRASGDPLVARYCPPPQGPPTVDLTVQSAGGAR